MIEFASNEEKYFSWYLDELLIAGYVKRWKYQPKPFVFTDPVRYNYPKVLKTKVNIESREFLKGYSYTADFLIVWNTDISNDFYQIINQELNLDIKLGTKPFVAWIAPVSRNVISVIDVKGTYSQNDAYSRFSKDQKLVWHFHGVYVQKIIPVPYVNKKGKVVQPSALFHATFTPEKFLFTEKKGDRKKLRFNVRTLSEYIESTMGDLPF